MRRCDEREVNNREDDEKTRSGNETNNREGDGGKFNDQVDAVRKSYYEAVFGRALRTEKIFVGDSILRKINKTKSKEDDVVVCLPGAKIEHVTERVTNILGNGQGGSILVFVWAENADREGTTIRYSGLRHLTLCNIWRVDIILHDELTSHISCQRLFALNVRCIASIYFHGHFSHITLQWKLYSRYQPEGFPGFFNAYSITSILYMQIKVHYYLLL